MIDLTRCQNFFRELHVEKSALMTIKWALYVYIYIHYIHIKGILNADPSISINVGIASNVRFQESQQR